MHNYSELGMGKQNQLLSLSTIENGSIMNHMEN